MGWPRLFQRGLQNLQQKDLGNRSIIRWASRQYSVQGPSYGHQRHVSSDHRNRDYDRLKSHSSISRAFGANAHSEDGEGSSISVDIPVPYQLHKLTEGPPQCTHTTKDQLMQYYRDMSVIRRVEITADMLFKSQQIRGFCHLYDGQEAVAVGLVEALTEDDSIITAYRDHGLYLARGGTLFECLSELLGKKTGCSGGKGGSMHLYNVKKNFYGGWGIVGTSGPLGAGLSFTHKYLKKNSIAVTIYGDGAANQGQLFEAKNLAALWDLPLILLVENNHFGMGTAEWRASKHATYYDRVSYIPGLKVDGMDVFAVREAVRCAKEHCMSGKGPIVIECDTYRYHGHSMSDPGSTYRTHDEIKGIRQERDPINHVRKLLLKEGFAAADDLKNIDKEIRREVEEAAAKAKEAPPPDEKELFSQIYKNDAGLQPTRSVSLRD